MKKRLISLLLTLSMVFSMVPMLGIGVGATGAYHKDNKWCTMVPFAYRAASISSIDYFQAFKSILYYGYDSEKIKTDFEKTPFYVIYSDLYWDRSWFEEVSHGARELLTDAFSDGNPTDLLRNDDIYDALLLNALIDSAIDNENSSKSFSFWADLLEGFSDATITIENTTYLFFSYIMDQDKSQLAKIAENLLTVEDSEVISFVIDGKTYECDTLLTGAFNKIKTYINDKFPNLDIDSKVKDMGDFLDLLSYLATFLDEGKEWIDSISKYIYIYDNISVNAGLVLREMYSCTEDEYLQRAINKFSDIIADESIWSMLKALFVDLGSDLLLDVSLTIAADQIRGALAKNPVYATALATFKFIDMFTNLSGREEQDYLIYITHNFNAALVKAMVNIEGYLWANENRHWSDYDAVMFGEAYTFGLRMCWRTLAQELNTATEYYKVFLSNKKYKEELGENWESHVEWMTDLYLETKPNQLEETKLYNHCLDVIADGVTIKYDINGGNETIPNQAKKYHGYVNLSSVVPTKEGHVFKGWAFSTYTADDFLYQPGEEIGPYLKNLGNSLEACFCSNELILVAQWSTDESVVYNGNGDNVKGLPAAQPNTGHTLLSPAIPTRDGYKFLGWDTDPSVKSPAYKAGVTNVYTGNGYVSLYLILIHE